LNIAALRLTPHVSEMIDAVVSAYIHRVGKK